MWWESARLEVGTLQRAYGAGCQPLGHQQRILELRRTNR
jgi:hypothetical protein